MHIILINRFDLGANTLEKVASSNFTIVYINAVAKRIIETSTVDVVKRIAEKNSILYQSYWDLKADTNVTKGIWEDGIV